MGWGDEVYATDAELKHFARITHSDADAEVTIANTASSRAIDNHCNRQFGVVAAVQERFYTAKFRGDRGRWVIDVDDYMSTTNMVVEVDGVALTTFTKEPRNAAAEGKPWTRLVVDEDSAVVPTGTEFEISATVIWGWTAVPTTVKQAALLQGSRFLARRVSPFGIAGSPEVGSEMRLLSRVDPDVAVALRGYVRPRMVG
jgi:hypothetical protein